MTKVVTPEEARRLVQQATQGAWRAERANALLEHIYLLVDEAGHWLAIDLTEEDARLAAAAPDLAHTVDVFEERIRSIYAMLDNPYTRPDLAVKEAKRFIEQCRRKDV